MEEEKKTTNFIKNIIDGDLKSGKNGDQVVTRFPPEPNGYLHIGHAKSIFLNFGIAQDYATESVEAKCHLRFDDTNPEKEDQEYVNSIMEDIKWLGADWGDSLHHSSDYFQKFYEFALDLIEQGNAYVCELSAEKMREYRGDLQNPGKEGPHRNRPISENLELFKKMKEGQFEEGSCILRAKIDMSSANMNMRDPAIYRIKKAHHQRTGDQWCIYPMYDYCHCISDGLEGITHSLCTLEFEGHRPLYDWFLDKLAVGCHPQQIEFSRLNLEYTVMSKRKLLELVEKKYVDGWDDPRIPTISGMRRRGYRPEAIRSFCDQVGVTKKESIIAMTTLETNVRDDLGPIAPRYFAVIDPLKVVITNFENPMQEIEAEFHSQDDSFGKRKIHFGSEIYIEKADFKEEANRKYFGLRPGGQVRLKYAYVLTCDEVIKGLDGEVIELRCRYHEDTFAGVTPEGMKKVKGIINWVNISTAIEIECRLYDRLFDVPNPLADKDKSFLEYLYSDSLKTVISKVEPSFQKVNIGERVQFERQGYFIVDRDTTSEKMVVNRIITLKDNWKFK